MQIQQTPGTLITLLAQARGSEEAAASITSAQIEAAYDFQRGPYRRRSFFVAHATTERDETTSPRKEEQLAKRLFSGTRSLRLPGGDELRLLDYQFPLKATRSDEGVGKVDLVGITGGGAFSLVELKTGESTENPLIGLLEVLAYGAIVRDNLPTISGELRAMSETHQPLSTLRFFIVAPPAFWER